MKRRCVVDRILLVGILALQAAILARLFWPPEKPAPSLLPSDVAAARREGRGADAVLPVVVGGSFLPGGEGERTALCIRHELFPSAAVRSEAVLRQAHEMQARMDKAFWETVQEFARGDRPSGPDDAWDMLFPFPSIDMRENPDSYVIISSLPGIDAGHMSITLAGRTLTVSALQRAGGTSFHGAREFKRTFRFPGPVVNDPSAEAWVSNGVLRVMVPKAYVPNPPKKALRLL